MLSDRERQQLRELERRIAAEDPDLRRLFDSPPHLRRPDQPRTSVFVAVVVAVLIGVPVLAAGSLTGALAFAAVTALVWAAWRYSSEPTDRDRRT